MLFRLSQISKEEKGLGIRDKLQYLKSRENIEKLMKIQSYRDLKVWQEGMELAEKCYLVT